MFSDKSVNITNHEIPVRIRTDKTVDVHIDGGRYFIIAFSALMSMLALYGIVDGIHQSNELKRKELEIQKQSLELDKRKFALDSLMYYNNVKQK